MMNKINVIKNYLLFGFALLFCTWSCSSTKNTSTSMSSSSLTSNEKLVRQAFENYKTAILNDRGEEAVSYVDSRTIEYYTDILDKTIYADSLTTSDLSLLDKLMVLSIRQRTASDKILSFDGKSLLVYAIKEGMVGKNSVANNEIGDIEIVDAFAKGQLLHLGNPAPMYFHFYKEAGFWKTDLTALFPMATVAFDQMVKESEMEENEYLLMLLEMVSGETPKPNIWNAIKDR